MAFTCDFNTDFNRDFAVCPVHYTQGVNGQFDCNGDLTKNSTFLQSVAGSFTFNGTVGRVLTSVAGGAINILQRITRGGET